MEKSNQKLRHDKTLQVDALRPNSVNSSNAISIDSSSSDPIDEGEDDGSSQSSSENSSFTSTSPESKRIIPIQFCGISMGAKQSTQYPIDHSPSLVASNKESRGELRKKSSARNIAPSSVSTSPETLTRDIPQKLGGGKGNMSTTTTSVLKEAVGLKSETEAKKNFLQDTTGIVKSTVREFPIPGGKKRGFEMESPEETTNSRTPRNESQLPPVVTPEFDNLGVGIKQNITDGSPQTPSIKSRDLTDIFDKSVVMGDSNQRNGQIKNVGPPKDTSRLKGEEKNLLISSAGTPAKSQKPPTSIASKKITAGSDLTSPKKAGPIINLPTPAPTAKKSEPKEETTVFTQITGKKKTRKLPNLGDFAKQKPVDLIDEGLDDTTPGEDLTKEDLTELEKAEKLLEESYASGKTKKILPEKEGETVRQELIIEGDQPGETKKIIQEITKRRISNPGKLPKELLAQMDKKDGIYTIYETRTKMTTTRLHGHDTSDFADMNEEDLLTKLTQQELDELANDVDPDDPLLPASERCRILTKKDPTGPLNRRNLLKYLEHESINLEDWEEPVPFKKVVRGSVWKPKERPKSKDEYRISIDLPDEYESALNDASEADLVDIAGILELHSLVNQTQYNNSLKSLSTEKGGFRAIARGDKLKILPPEPPNLTDPSKTLDKLEKNDPSLTRLVLNNIRDIAPATYLSIARSFKHNSHIENVSLSNTRITDTLAKVLADSIRENKSIRSLNLESNALSPEAVVYVFGAICDNPNIIEFKAANQRNTYLGNKAEMDIATLMASNHHLLRLGLTLNVPDARSRIAGYLKRNLDELRLRRLQLNSQ